MEHTLLLKNAAIKKPSPMPTNLVSQSSISRGVGTPGSNESRDTMVL